LNAGVRDFFGGIGPGQQQDLFLAYSPPLQISWPYAGFPNNFLASKSRGRPDCSTRVRRSGFKRDLRLEHRHLGDKLARCLPIGSIVQMLQKCVHTVSGRFSIESQFLLPSCLLCRTSDMEIYPAPFFLCLILVKLGGPRPRNDSPRPCASNQRTELLKGSRCKHSQSAPDAVRNLIRVHTCLLESFPSSHCWAICDGTLLEQQ
jgi:hypothetical protein